MFKRIFTLFLAVVMIFACLCSCSDSQTVPTGEVETMIKAEISILGFIYTFEVDSDKTLWVSNQVPYYTDDADGELVDFGIEKRILSKELSDEEYKELIKLYKHLKKVDAENSYIFDGCNVLVKIEDGDVHQYAYDYNSVENKKSIYLIEKLTELSPMPIVYHKGDKIVPTKFKW